MNAETSPETPPTNQPAQSSLNDYLYLFFEPITDYLKDDDVSEILINGYDQIYIEKAGKLHPIDAHFVSEDALMAAAVNVARAVGRTLNEKYPILDARLPDGSRVSVVIPPVARVGTVVSIRKFRKDALRMKDLIRYASIDEQGATLIETIVQLRKNVMVSGATSSGKTSVLNVLSSFISHDERILVIEDSSELQLQQRHVVGFETRKPDRKGEGEISIRALVKASLRLRPDRLIIGEIRGGEAIDLLQALNTGHSGSMSTIHANTAADSLLRLETCALMSGIDMPLNALRAQVADAIQVVIQTARLSDGSRKITGISEVTGLDERGNYVVHEIYGFTRDQMDEQGNIHGHFGGHGNLPSFFAEAESNRLPIDKKWFKK